MRTGTAAPQLPTTGLLLRLMFLSPLVFLLRVTAVHQTSHLTGRVCDVWDEEGVESALEGESSFLTCPLSSHSLLWFRLLGGRGPAQPITDNFTLSRDSERLWLQPVSAQDAGLYICVLSNESSCSQTSVRLKVQSRPEAPPPGCPPQVATPPSRVIIPLQDSGTLDCPGAELLTQMIDSGSSVSVTWFHVAPYGKCYQYPFWNQDRRMVGSSLRFLIMSDMYRGSYFCTVSYLRRGRSLSFTRSINVSAVFHPTLPKEPSVQIPTIDQVYTARRGFQVRLLCRGHFPYLDSSPWDIWWTVDGTRLDQLADPRFSSKNSPVKTENGDRIEDSVLVIENFRPEDVDLVLNCSVQNQRGSETRRARLQEEVSLPLVELGCGLVLVLVFLLLLVLVHHVFWLEMLLLYRSWFGSDERHTDDKEYDVYISYARNTEDELFVVSTLRGVLENHFGFSVCIFERDSLPGGTITDDTLRFVSRSRRLLVVLSPGYGAEGSQALLELKAGIDGMALGGELRVILVQFRPLRRESWVRELRRARVALALVQWRGEKSRALSSRFWKRLRVELPAPRAAGGGPDKPIRFYSQNSTSSQTGLLCTAGPAPVVLDPVAPQSPAIGPFAS